MSEIENKKRINITVDSEAYDNALPYIKEFGLSLSSTINMLLKAINRTRSIPFDISISEDYEIEFKERRKR